MTAVRLPRGASGYKQVPAGCQLSDMLDVPTKCRRPKSTLALVQICLNVSMFQCPEHLPISSSSSSIRISRICRTWANTLLNDGFVRTQVRRRPLGCPGAVQVPLCQVRAA